MDLSENTKYHLPENFDKIAMTQFKKLDIDKNGFIEGVEVPKLIKFVADFYDNQSGRRK